MIILEIIPRLLLLPIFYWLFEIGFLLVSGCRLRFDFVLDFPQLLSVDFHLILIQIDTELKINQSEVFQWIFSIQNDILWFDISMSYIVFL